MSKDSYSGSTLYTHKITRIGDSVNEISNMHEMCVQAFWYFRDSYLTPNMNISNKNSTNTSYNRVQ